MFLSTVIILWDWLDWNLLQCTDPNHLANPIKFSQKHNLKETQIISYRSHRSIGVVFRKKALHTNLILVESVCSDSATFLNFALIKGCDKAILFLLGCTMHYVFHPSTIMFVRMVKFKSMGVGWSISVHLAKIQFAPHCTRVGFQFNALGYQILFQVPNIASVSDFSAMPWITKYWDALCIVFCTKLYCILYLFELDILRCVALVSNWIAQLGG